jgi:molybdopterin/thiamine biosynthesis adenylyltransferase
VRTAVAVIGLGGLGSPAALALARAGVTPLGLFDGDRVEVHNLPRQTLFTDADLGRPKAEAAAERLASLAPATELIVYGERLGAENVRLLDDFSVWIDATDQLQSKLWFNDCAVARGAILVHGGAIRFGGQALLVVPGVGPCLRCLIQPEEADGAETCAAEGIAGPVVGVVGSLMADLALQALTGHPVAGRCVRFDATKGELREWVLPRRSDCPTCGVRVVREASNAATRP